jgi:hypothetical protein
VYTGLNQIHDMEFGTTTNGGEAYLVVAGSTGSGGGVVVYKRTVGGTGLEKVARNKAVPTRTSFVWV